MANPTSTARTEPPSGIRYDDGYRTTIAFASQPAVSFWEKTVKPPAIDGGDAIETTTMHNNTWRTKRPKSLKTLSECQTMAAYDPSVITTILTMINVETSITIHFADGSTLDFFGYLNKFEPGDCKEGEQPEATVQIVPTNWDYANHIEAGPVFTSVTGT